MTRDGASPTAQLPAPATALSDPVNPKPGDLTSDGWRHAVATPSLPEVHRTIPVIHTAQFWRRLLAFTGPGYIIAVGYMDPGNWATDISGGAVYNYALLSVVLISNFMAMYLQALAAKLGLVTGRDLAQACRDTYTRPVVIGLWLSAEVAIVACDIAEVLGAAIALNLLFHVPLVWGVVLTALDVLIVLALQHKGFRLIEALVITLIVTMMIIFGIEIALSRPDWGGVLQGFVPTTSIVRNSTELYIALGIVGATVMPHNLYLHSSVIQTRQHGRSVAELRDAIRWAYTDSTVALTFAFFVNAAILIVAAATFYRSGHHEVGAIQDAYQLMTPLLGATVATPLFAIALLASGQNSTLTGTLAGQVVLEGFTNFTLAPWARRLVSRSLAIVPAVFAVAWYGDKGMAALIIFSQVVLSAQLSFAIVPLIQFTSNRAKMGPFVNGPITRYTGWTLAAVIAVLNVYLIYTSLQ
ncbi:MAG TPA: Nramp family divalent metal transporter [Gemmatimonadaceae bacterium]|nr:Nramp family divalent metal transporter [Gemmatimonadaceae bacterium]